MEENNVFSDDYRLAKYHQLDEIKTTKQIVKDQIISVDLKNEINLQDKIFENDKKHASEIEIEENDLNAIFEEDINLVKQIKNDN